MVQERFIEHRNLGTGRYKELVKESLICKRLNKQIGFKNIFSDLNTLKKCKQNFVLPVFFFLDRGRSNIDLQQTKYRVGANGYRIANDFIWSII